jgi:hypothetical protein
MSNPRLEAALFYCSLGWSVIPLKPGDKKPLTAWERHQRERATPDMIREWWSKFPDANIGIVTGKISGIAVIDIDEKIGFIEIEKYIALDLLTPQQRTPRGGLHIICKHPLNIELPNNARTIPGCDFRGDGGYIVIAPSTNSTGRPYAWLKGREPSKCLLAELPQSYIDAITSKKREPRADDAPGDMYTPGRRDEDLFHIANCMVKGGAKQHEVSQTLERLALSCGYPQSDIRIKVESAIKRAEKKDRKVSVEISEYIAGTEGYFTNEEIYRALALNNADEKATARKALERLVKEGVVERHGNKDGVFRRIEKEIERIDYRSAGTDALPVMLPLDIHKLINIYPGNIITISGTANSGKTAFLLNTVAINMMLFRVVYLSSEMGNSELKIRLKNFDNVPFDDWKFEAYERSNNFADVIKPGAKPTIWIIDYLELLTDFWKVASLLKDIHDKLAGKDIAIVAIQKAPGADTGRGGAFGLEKPRLALAMEAGKIKIVKAKNWRTDKNPNGLYREFKLVKGYKFCDESEFYYDDDNKLFKKQ